MSEKEKMELLIREIKLNNLSRLQDQLITQPEKITSSKALHILVALSKVAVEYNEKVNFVVFLDVLKQTLALVTTATNFDAYLHSIFVIMKTYLNSGKYDFFSELEAPIFPSFSPAELSPSETKFYESIGKVLYNSLTKMDKIEQKSAYKKNIILLYKILVKTQNSATSHEILTCSLTATYKYAHLSTQRKYEIFKTGFGIISSFPTFESVKDILRLLEYFHSRHEFGLGIELHEILIAKIEKNDKLGVIFDFVAHLSPHTPPKQPLKATFNAFKSYTDKHPNLDADLSVIVSYLSLVSAILVRFYHTDSKKWLERPLDDQLTIYKLFYHLHKFALDKQCFFVRIFALAQITASSNDAPVVYRQKVLGYVDNFLAGNLNELSSKHYLEATMSLYTIGTVGFGRNAADRVSEWFLQRLITLIFRREGTAIVLVKERLLVSALMQIVDFYLGIGEPEKAMVLLALAAATCNCGELRGKVLNKWITTKVAIRESEHELNLVDVTFVSILKRNATFVGTYLPNSVAFEFDKTELLAFELGGYLLKWKSTNSMFAVLNGLLAVAKVDRLAEIVVETWSKDNLRVHDDFYLAISKIVTLYERHNPKKEFILGWLYFLDHKYSLSHQIVRNIEEVEKVSAVKVEKIENEDDKNVCDIVTTYETLKFTNYERIISKLDKTFQFLGEKCRHLNENHFELYQLWTQVGHEYYLHINYKKAAIARYFALEYAKRTKNPLFIIEATGYLIELSPVQSDDFKQLDEVEKLMKEVKEYDFNVIVGYFLCKFDAYYRTNVKIAEECYKKAKEYIKGELDVNLRARLNLVKHKLISLPINCRIRDEHECTCVHIHLGHESATSYWKNAQGRASYQTAIFLQLGEEIGRMYAHLRMPREVRGYTSNLAVLSQKLVLPQRALRFLFYLAQADLMNCRFDDCRVKIDGINSMLTGMRSLNVEKSIKRSPLKSPTNVDNVTNDFREMVLNVIPSSANGKVYQRFDGSPGFAVETFKSPDFLHHKVGCECQVCDWNEYGVMFVAKALLEGLLHFGGGELRLARDFYSGANRIYEFIKKRLDSTRNYYFLLEIYFGLLKESVNLLLKIGNVEAGEQLHAKFLQSFQRKSVAGFEQVANVIVVQQMAIFALRQRQPRRAPPAEVGEAAVESGVKTPENRTTAVYLDRTPAASLATIDLPKKRLFKAIKTNLFADDAKTPKIMVNDRLVADEEGVFVSPPKPNPITEKKKQNRSKLLTEKLKNSCRKAQNENDKESGARVNLLKELEGAEKAEVVVRRSKRNLK